MVDTLFKFLVISMILRNGTSRSIRQTTSGYSKRSKWKCSSSSRTVIIRMWFNYELRSCSNLGKHDITGNGAALPLFIIAL
jgi:hypothetical protein